MKRLISCLDGKFNLLLVCCVCWIGLAGTGLSADNITLNGGGASFPMPLYLKWFKDYHHTNPNVVINYNAIGSGAGVHNFMTKRFDFAGTDTPMAPEEVAKAESGVIQLPLAAGAIVLIYNLELDNLRLSREAYAGIFLGKVKNWQDPLIAKENKGVELPNKEIILVTRVESSGTSQIMTEHLSAINETFAKTVGTSKDPVWPSSISKEGRLIKADGNGGVAQMVKVLPNSIGYVEFSYAYFTKISMATLQNRSSQFVLPTTHSFAEALASALPSLDMPVPKMPADAMGDGAYPILSLTWILCNETYDNPIKLHAIKDVFSYCLTEGQKYNSRLGYLALPEPLLSKARLIIETIKLNR